MTRQADFVNRAARLADIALAIAGLFALAAFLHNIYYYGWTRQREFVNGWYSTLYYALPLLVSVALLASLRFSPVRRVNLAITLLSAALSVYGFELIVESRYFPFKASAKPAMSLLADSRDRKRDAAELSRRAGKEVDARTAEEVLSDFRAKGTDAIPIATPSNQLFISQTDGSIKSAITIDGQEVMPLAAVANKATLLCNETGQWIDYRSDAHGFNNADEVWHVDRLRVAALGDSFVHGYCVPDDANFVALIRRRYPATLNLGIAGDGPLLMLATLQEYVVPLKPRIVLWFYYEGNDLTDLQIERKSALLMKYLKDGFTQPDLARQNDVDRAIMDEMPRLRGLERENQERRQRGRLTRELVEFARLTVLRQRFGLVGGYNAGDNERAVDLERANMQVFRDALVQAKGRVNAWGGTLYFVDLPEWARYASGYTSWGIAHSSEVRTLVSGLGIPVVDVDAAFRAHGDPLSLFPFRELGHYNETGHRLVAEEVLKSISPSIP